MICEHISNHILLIFEMFLSSKLTIPFSFVNRSDPVQSNLKLTASEKSTASEVLTPLLTAVKSGQLKSSIDGTPISFSVSDTSFRFITSNGKWWNEPFSRIWRLRNLFPKSINLSDITMTCVLLYIWVLALFSDWLRPHFIHHLNLNEKSRKCNSLNKPNARSL